MNETFTKTDDFICMVGSQITKQKAKEITPKDAQSIFRDIVDAKFETDNQKGIGQEISQKELDALKWKNHYVLKYHLKKKAIKNPHSS